MDENDARISAEERRRALHSPHPWWSRILYLVYGIFVGIGSVSAAIEGESEVAFGAGGIAMVLIWMATQRRR